MSADRVAFAFKVRVGCVVAVVAVFYAPGFGGFWLGDDFANIASFYQLEQDGRLLSGTLGYFVHGLSPAGSFYRPLSMVSLVANYVTAGMRYEGWYLTSFVVHLANVTLIALVVHRLARLCKGDASWSGPLSALLFGLSPMLAEGVYWQSARADGWVTLLSLLAVRAWVGSARASWLLLPLLAAALTFKESAALLPLQLGLLAWALPGKHSRAQWASLLLGFALVGAFMGWRAHLFGNAWRVYSAPSAVGLDPDWSTLVADVVSTVPWWTATMVAAPAASTLYLCTLGAVIVIAACALPVSRPRAWIAIALVCASAGMVLATLLNLGGLPPTGEGGRLTYGPMAWLALAIGVSCARMPVETRSTASFKPRIAALSTMAVACVIGAWTLWHVMGQALQVQDSVRALTRALPAWADWHEGLSLVIVPERMGSVVMARNAQGGLAMPPFQSRPVLHRVLPTLPSDIATRYTQFRAGLATRLAEHPPQRIDPDTMLKLAASAASRWPDRYACWSPLHRRIVEMRAPRTSSEDAWSVDLLDAARTTCGALS